MSIKDKQIEIIETFSLFEEWTDRYEYIIDLGKDLPLISSEKKDEEHLIKGCQSQVWLDAVYDGKLIHFYADSDAIVTSGIISLLIKIISGNTPHDIFNADLFFLKELGLQDHLSMSRSNGLIAMIEKMKYFAKIYMNSENG